MDKGILYQWTGYLDTIGIYPVNTMHPFRLHFLHYFPKNYFINTFEFKWWWWLVPLGKPLPESFRGWCGWWLVGLLPQKLNLFPEEFVKNIRELFGICHKLNITIFSGCFDDCRCKVVILT